MTTSPNEACVLAGVPLAWFALKVRARGEALVGGYLESKGYEVFLPSYLESRKYSDRIVRVTAALFPGYLFCQLDPSRRLPVLTTPGVEHIVGFGGAPEPVPEAELDAVRRVLEAGAQAVPWPYLATGQKVRIEFGALRGVEGLVTRIRGEERLILSVNLLQRSICVDIDRSWIRPLQIGPSNLAVPGSEPKRL